MKAEITAKDERYLNIAWEDEEGFGHLNFKYIDSGVYMVDSEFIGVEKLAKILKAL